jgi:4-diphosphocytidyl-2-C-methyl-D-erythritol kinase
VVVFPNCKINLGLNIIRKRSDGFHDLETVFYPLPIHDVLELIPFAGDTHTDDISFTMGGLTIEGNKEDNLCSKAWYLLKKDFPQLPPVQMYLYKTIPAGAGLGGGSADAVFALKLVNTLFELKLSREQLFDYSLQLGSDCPFFISNKPCFATGRGETLEEINIDLGFYKFILLNPAIPIHTANAFAQTTPSLPLTSIKEIIQQPVTEWKELLKNDFEGSVFRQFPEIKKIKDELYDAGAIYASLSGSGSTVYGIFEKEKEVQLSFPDHYFVRELMNI